MSKKAEREREIAVGALRRIAGRKPSAAAKATAFERCRADARAALRELGERAA